MSGEKLVIKAEDLDFRPLDRRQVETLVGWARDEGWDPGVNDAELFYTSFPDGFYGFFAGEELIGGGSLVSYGGEYGFMGFFIVRPEYRGAGIGRGLWLKRRDTLLARLKKGAGIGMDGVVAMQSFYQRGGFALACRDERRARPGAVFPVSPAVSPIEPADFPAIAAFDRECFGFAREDFLRRWLFDGAARAFKYLAADGLAGFAVLRRTGNGYKIGPLFAVGLPAARELYRACLAAVPGATVFLDIPMHNPDAVALAAEFNAQYVFECGRMYYGPPPVHRLDRVFGVTTFELG